MLHHLTMKHGAQKQIAEKAEITSQFVNQILSGRRRPSWSVAKRLAAITNTKPELWLDGQPEDIKQALDEMG